MISFVTDKKCFDMFCGDKFSDDMFCLSSEVIGKKSATSFILFTLCMYVRLQYDEYY